MTPKEKAIELVDKCYQLFPLQKDVIANVCDLSWKYDNWKQAKQCALIAVNEILYVLPQHEYLEDRGEYTENRERIFWQEVKQEIEAL